MRTNWLDFDNGAVLLFEEVDSSPHVGEIETGRLPVFVLVVTMIFRLPIAGVACPARIRRCSKDGYGVTDKQAGNITRGSWKARTGAYNSIYDIFAP
jgi:hypothetical protein